MKTLIAIAAFIGAIWVIYDVWAVNKSLTPLAKVIWTICAICFSLITAIVYYFFGKKTV